MNRRNVIKLLATLLPCACVAKMLGEKDLHGTPSPNPASEKATYEDYGTVYGSAGYNHAAVQTPNLHNASDESLVKEFDTLNKKLEWLLQDCKKRGREIQDIKMYWRNIPRFEGPNKFVRILLRARYPSYPVYWRGKK